MIVMKNLIYILIFLIPMSTLANASDIDILRNSVVEINVQRPESDFVLPWQIVGIKQGSGSGVIIPGNMVLTAAHVIDYAEQINLRKPGSDVNYEAKVLYVSDASDLAILTIAEPDFYEGTKPVELAELPSLGDVITTIGFPTGGSQLAVTRGTVSRIDFHEYVHSSISNLVIQIDAAINPGASGGGAFINGKLAGVSFQGLTGDDLENIGYIIPTPVIRQFFEDIKDGVVNGVPALGINAQNMQNEQLRNFYKVPEDATGLLVTTSVMSDAGTADVLMKDDIILSIDNQPVGNDGMVAYQSGDRMDIGSLLKFRQIGDLLDLKILRQGKTMNLSITLQEQSINMRPVITHTLSYTPDYVVIGGLVIQELSVDYIEESFSKSNIPAWMNLAMNNSYTSSNRDRYLFTSAILPHRLNMSYQDFEDKRITKVNGATVKNLEDLKEIMNAFDDQYLKLELDDGQVVIFKRESLVAIDEELKDKFNY